VRANHPAGGIARHQHIARDNAMLGMVVNAELTAPSVAMFIRDTHEVGSFIELLCQHQLAEVCCAVFSHVILRLESCICRIM
jgi:hypothetical protein